MDVVLPVPSIPPVIYFMPHERQPSSSRFLCCGTLACVRITQHLVMAEYQVHHTNLTWSTRYSSTVPSYEVLAPRGDNSLSDSSSISSLVEIRNSTPGSTTISQSRIFWSRTTLKVDCTIYSIEFHDLRHCGN